MEPAGIMETAIKAVKERGGPPLALAMELARVARTRGMELPSLELGFALVDNLCFDNNIPSIWKFLEQALASKLVSAVHVLALLTARVVQNRRAEPEAYRLYLELLSRYLFTKQSAASTAIRDKIAKFVDESLQISHAYGIDKIDFGHVVIFFTLNVILSLMDATLEDWGSRFMSADKKGSKFPKEGLQVMDIDVQGKINIKNSEHRQHLQRSNSLIALEAVEKITANSKAKVFLRLIHLNMPDKFDYLLQRLRFIEAHKSTAHNIISANGILLKLFSNVQEIITEAYPLNKHRLLGTLVDAGTYSSTCPSSGTNTSGCWIPFDIFMENALDGKNLHAISAIEILTELTKTLQVVNQASWQETFLALWISALRLIQRDRDPWEGPIPRLETRLCMLLAIVPLAVFPIVREGNDAPFSRNDYEHETEKTKYSSRRQGLVLSLQLLGQFSVLLLPPPEAVTAANNAASKAATFILNFKSANGNLGSISDSSVRAVGNLLHLIIEACIARKLIDTSAYFWPGYVVPSAPSKESILVQESPWSLFMEGTQQIASLKNALMATPAPGIAELEKLYQIVLNGSEEERLIAVKILSSASLTYGWSIQEHVVRIVVKLLSPPSPPFTEPVSGSHQISHMPILGSLLFVLARVEIVHIFSLYGLVPEVAAALMPLSEAFGSIAPQSNHRSNPSDETSIYSVFSCAFLLLLRLWKFYKPPQENCIGGRGGTVRVELTLDYLLLMRNSRMALEDSIFKGRCNNNNSDSQNSSPGQPIYIDSFPKLHAWYLQNQACVASTLSGLCNKNPVHQVANKILNMICRKMSKVGIAPVNPSSTSSGSISGSPASAGEDAYQRPTLPAWEILEAVPFVLEAVLTACSHGKLSSRDLTTGLRDLVDFLPASLATIVSYFSAEITRGVWKPVSMNGTDWPSPAANLLSVESEIKEILASAGVQVPYIYASGTAPMLPLPMAALVSLTITFKLEKNLDYIHAVVGQALENCSSGCSWPSMPIIGALWTQKVKRWHDYIVFSCTHSPFSRDKGAVDQLIRSCFLSFFGRLRGSQLTSKRGASGLLGCSVSEKGSSLSIAPGFMYLRTCRTFHDPHFVNNTVLRLVIEWVHDLSASFNNCNSLDRKNSLASTTAAVREVVMLGVSLLCIAGGVQMVQFLYEETLPAALMTARENGNVGTVGPSAVLEGYAMAYMVILSGAFVWGVGPTSAAFSSAFSSRRARTISVHMEFMGGAVIGDVALGCNPVTWKAYVSCFVGLMVGYVPGWVSEVRKETLKKLANGLKSWHENELALELLERGGHETVATVVESMM